MSIEIAFLGHSTVRIQTDSVSFLTDPVFSERVLWCRRKTPFPVPPERLPEPSAIFVSHAHYDHLDLPTFKYFSSKIPIVLPQGIGRLLARCVKNPLIELTAGTTHEISDRLRVTAFPVTHGGFRLSGLTYRQCLGYLIESDGKKIFFPGDSAYRNDFKVFQKPHVALLPIGPCRPEWFMRPKHMTPEEAIRLAEELDAGVTIPIHWGTFRLGMEPIEEPIGRFRHLSETKGLHDRIAILQPGEKISL